MYLNKNQENQGALKYCSGPNTLTSAAKELPINHTKSKEIVTKIFFFIFYFL